MILSGKLKRKAPGKQLSGELKTFEKWCEKRKIAVDLKTISLSPTDLTEILRKFFAKGKTEKGQAVLQIQ